MQVQGIDHVNIVARDLEETIGFYERALGLRRAESPGSAMGFRGAWLLDASDRAIIHLMAHDLQRHGPLRERAQDAAGDGRDTGSIDHVALACADFEAMLARCQALELNHRVNDRQFGALRQIFITDPNGVVLELNFTD